MGRNAGDDMPVVGGIQDRTLSGRRGSAPRLFTARLGDVATDTLDRLSATLDDGERRRRDALLREASRRLFELSHGLMRHAVAVRLGVALDAVRLRVEVGEKPVLLAPRAGLDLSLTHSGDFAACAVLEGGLVGVDAEQPRSGRAPRVETMLAPEERAWLAGHDAPDGLLAVWTLKEAVAKALGLGLRLGFDGFAVQPGPPPRVIRAPAAHRGPWHLWQDGVGGTTVAAAWSPGA